MIDVACVDHQHLVSQVSRLAFVQEPKGARQSARIEELVANRHHHIDMAALNQLFANVAVFIARVRRAGRHYEPSAASWI